MTFKQHQQQCPDALSVTLTSKTPVTIEQARSLLYGTDTDVLLLENFQKGNKYTFIFSKEANVIWPGIKP
jgi:hypothetical protein